MDKKATGKKILCMLGIALLVLVGVIVFLALTGTVAHAAGLVDDTISDSNLYSKYPLSNYQLDFYVDNSWNWLPWNWLDGIGKSVQYGLYCITNFIWTISLYLSNATGYVVQQAYKLDFISDMADSIGKSIQTIAGVTANGFSSSGFYVGFLLLLVLIVGIYVAYVGLIKRETSKALHAVINFVVVFLVSASFIAYAPDYIKKVNEFSADISTAALDVGTKIILPDSESRGKDSVDLIRDSLFSMQVQQPWLLLQFGNSDMEEIGADRVEALLSASPSDNDGKTREDVVKTEIEDKDNDNLTIPQVVNRLGMVFFLLIFNLGITIFVFLLTGMMIFSQILFIIFAMFLPVSFLLSMIPSYENMAKQAIVKVFNTIMSRAGITLIITVAFSISSMFYQISANYPFFMTAFLQIVTFAGIYFELGNLMSMFNLNVGDSQNIGRRIFRRPYMFMRHRTRRMERRIARAVNAGSIAGSTAGTVANSLFTGGSARKSNQNKKQRNNTVSSFRDQAGAKAGAIKDTKNHIKDKAQQVKESVKDMPTQPDYAVNGATETAKKTVSNFKSGVTQEQKTRLSGCSDKLNRHHQSVADRRRAMQKAQEEKQHRQTEKTAAGTSSIYKRPAVVSSQEKKSQEKTSVKEPTTKPQRPVTQEKVPSAFGNKKCSVTSNSEIRPVIRREMVSTSKDLPVNQAVTQKSETGRATRTVQVRQVQERQIQTASTTKTEVNGKQDRQNRKSSANHPKKKGYRK